MIWAPLIAFSLAATVATGPVGDQFGPKTADRQSDALQATVHAATECIVHAIAADPRAREGDPSTMIGELIAMPACAGRMRDMIDAYDASYGAGSGEAFFMGPYLDLLPNAAGRMLKAGSHIP